MVDGILSIQKMGKSKRTLDQMKAEKKREKNKSSGNPVYYRRYTPAKASYVGPL
jgi:hypothetical protein